MIPTIALILIILFLVALNIVATVRVIKDALSERTQKVWQLIFIWLLPLFGSLVVLMVHRKQEDASGRYPEDNTIEEFGINIRQHSVADDFLD